ncbi:AMP-binding protein [Pseudoduganella sp. FT93W]|uniref:AMP-binding protein n=1 Tax=Duganella fentianensis TaxID=2692177 RepID=A0A845HYJ4_9BURK|nr:AMP-binding protein [Duganella fentianensis]MYN46069.1 AMP-binding protein [Duganella fentianensis]
MNFYDELERYSDRTALITEQHGHTSYGQLAQTADALGAALPPHSLVLCLCDNNLESVAGYLGLLRRRCVPLLVNSSIHPQLLDNLLQTYQPAYVYLPQAQAASVAGRSVHQCGDYSLLATAYADAATAPALAPPLAQLLTTSGSTGSPMLVRQSHGNIQSNAAAIADYLAISSDDRPITTLPLSYSYGLSILNSHLLQGCAIILTTRSLMDKEFWALLKREQATTFGGVPYVYEMLKRLRLGRMDLPSLKTLTQAGGRLGPELSAEFAALCADKGWRFIVMYGQTEATARMAYLPWEYAQSKAGSIGIAIPGGSFTLEDEHGATITAAETVGELVYRGPNVTLGYASCAADLARGDDNHGVLHTGDMAKRDTDGFYTIVGRMKRFLKLFGNRVNLEEVEQLLHAAGHEGVCHGVDDHLRFYSTSTDAAEHAAIKAFLVERTGLHGSAFEVRQIDAIPRNAAGKILYAALP